MLGDGPGEERVGQFLVGRRAVGDDFQVIARDAAIVAALRRWVVAQGGWTIRLIVQEQNPAALRFWSRQGFVEVGAAVQELEDRTNQVRRLELRL